MSPYCFTRLRSIRKEQKKYDSQFFYMLLVEGENIAIELTDFCSASIMSEEESIDHNQHSFIRSFIHSLWILI